MFNKKWGILFFKNKIVYISAIISLFIIFYFKNSIERNLVYELSLAYFSGFVFYWITVIKKEISWLEIYYLKTIQFFSRYLELIAIPYYSDKYKQIEGDYKSETVSEFIITIPFNCYKEFFPIKTEFQLKELKNLENKLIQKLECKKTYIENIKKDNLPKKIKSNVITDYESIYKTSKFRQIEKIEDFLKKYTIFFNDFNKVYFFLNINEIVNMEHIFNHFDEYKKQENSIDQYKLFLKNIESIQKRILNTIELSLNYLKNNKKIFPTIELKFTKEELQLNEKLIYQIYYDFYKNSKLNMYLITELELEKTKIKNIINENEQIYIVTEYKQIRFKNISEIYSDKKNIIFKEAKHQN